MAGAEKTFEQGVAIGMLLGRSANGGGGSDYKVKNPLLQYIIDNAKLVATCQLGKDYIIKYYADMINFDDPNAHLFYIGLRQSGIPYVHPQMSANGRYGAYIGQSPAKEYGLMSGISYMHQWETGIIAYQARVVFKGDAPLFGDLNYTTTSYNYMNCYYISKDNDGSNIIKDMCWYYSNKCYCTEEDRENIQYVGDFKWMFKVTLDTSRTTSIDDEDVPVTRAEWSYQLQTLEGEDVDSGRQTVRLPYRHTYYSPQQYTCMWTDPDTGETKEILDNTRPPRIIESGGGTRDYDFTLSLLILPLPQMLGVITPEQIKNEIIIMYDQMIRSSTIGDTGYVTGLVKGMILEHPEPTQ